MNLLSIITRSPTLAAITSLFIGYIIYKHLTKDRTLEQFYRTQPHIGKPSFLFPFPSLIAALCSFFSTPTWVYHGYKTYSKRNLPFLVSSLRKAPTLIVPPASFKAVLNNPEHIVGAFHPQSENISAKYTMRDEAIWPANHDVELVRKQITRRYGSVAREIDEEIKLALEEIWKVGEEFKDVKVWPKIEELACRALNRIIVGERLGRNERFLERVLTHARSILRDGILIGFLPDIVKPLLGPLMSLQTRKACEDSIAMLQPLVEQRLEQFRSGVYEAGSVPPNDILQWCIEESSLNSDPVQMTARRIAHRLIFLTFNTAPPAGLTLTSVFVDLFGSPNVEEYVQVLRQECEHVLRDTPEGYWTRAAVDKLVLLDSTIRESMRLSDFQTLAFPRRVTAPNGIKINDIHVPRGTYMEVPMHPIHIDPDNYDSPLDFHPFRFAGKKAVVTLDDTFLTFGYSRNGCPGRWLGVHLMKVMMAHILIDYDVEPLKEKPKMIEIMEIRMPRQWQALRFRKRESKQKAK